MPIGVVWRHSCLNRQSVSRDSKVRAPWIPGWQQDVINGSGDEVSIMQSPTTCWKHCRSTWRRVNEEKNSNFCRRHFRPILMWSQFYWRKSQRRHLHPGDQWRCSQVVALKQTTYWWRTQLIFLDDTVEAKFSVKVLVLGARAPPNKAPGRPTPQLNSPNVPEVSGWRIRKMFGQHQQFEWMLN